jgi:hypothetical protein
MLFNFGWFIHTSPEVNIESIRKEGLKPYRDATIPEDLKGLVARDHILCLHPLEAKECPAGVCNSLPRKTSIVSDTSGHTGPLITVWLQVRVHHVSNQ